MIAFLSSLAFVVLAEMGDKTQLLAIAFATKFPWKTVMAAVIAATAVNRLLAVIVGEWLTNYIPMDWIHIAASIAFIIFGLWTIRGDKITDDDQKERCKTPSGPWPSPSSSPKWATRPSSPPSPWRRSSTPSSPYGAAPSSA